MHAQYFFVNQCANWKILKSLAVLLPYLEAILIEGPLAVIFEAINLVNKPTLVVSSKQCDVSWIPELVSQ